MNVQRKLLPSTRQAIQAAVAVAGVSLLSHWFPQLQRPYWAIITALVVLCQTWSESVKKAAQRVAATFLGLLAAAVLYRLLSPWPTVETIVIFVCVFLLAYTMTTSYLWAIFWMTVMVIMMFDMLGSMDNRLVVERMVETLLGALMAVLVSVVVLPVRVRGQLRSDVPEFLQILRTACVRSLDAAAGRDVSLSDPAHTTIIKSFHKVQDDFRTRQRETFLLRREPSRLRRWILWMELLTFYAVDMHQAVEQGRNDKLAECLREELDALREHIASAFDRIDEAFKEEKEIGLASPDDLIEAVRAKVRPLLLEGVERRRACIRFLPILYYLVKIYRVLEEMAAKLNTRAR